MSIKNFARGMGSVIDIFPSENGRNYIIKTENLSDAEAFQKDAHVIEQDFKNVIGCINDKEQENDSAK